MGVSWRAKRRNSSDRRRARCGQTLGFRYVAECCACVCRNLLGEDAAKHERNGKARRIRFACLGETVVSVKLERERPDQRSLRRILGEATIRATSQLSSLGRCAHNLWPHRSGTLGAASAPASLPASAGARTTQNAPRGRGRGLCRYHESHKGGSRRESGSCVGLFAFGFLPEAGRLCRCPLCCSQLGGSGFDRVSAGPGRRAEVGFWRGGASRHSAKRRRSAPGGARNAGMKPRTFNYATVLYTTNEIHVRVRERMCMHICICHRKRRW